MFRFDRLLTPVAMVLLGAAASLAAFACQSAAWRAAREEQHRRLASTARDLFHLAGVTLYASALVSLGFSPPLAVLVSGFTAALQEAVHHAAQRASLKGALLGLALSTLGTAFPERVADWSHRLAQYALH